ncbi:MAG: hypothetical protein LPK19_12300, partial [Hymenobacteraceae bacterium]|nr:hypothetical protein [Hymenobacteraceae bacterium]MDX5513079.1 hypothetical protein [Hymenobacteraceae bacterium]
LYLPSDLTGAFSGNVGKIFFRYNTTTGNTLTDFTVKMGQTSNTGFSPSTTFYTGLTTVLSEPSYTIPAGNAGDWFEIPLTTTFSYDATQTLIVELEFTASATTGFSTRSSTKSGQKLYSSSVGATTGTATTTRQDFGMQVAAAGTDVTFASLSAGTTTGCLTAT